MSKKFMFFIMILCVLAFYGGGIVSAKSEPKQLETEGFCFLNYSETERGSCTYISAIVSGCTNPEDNCRVAASVCETLGVLSINIISTCE